MYERAIQKSYWVGSRRRAHADASANRSVLSYITAWSSRRQKLTAAQIASSQKYHSY